MYGLNLYIGANISLLIESLIFFGTGLIVYDLPYHKEKDPMALRQFIAQYPFATLCGSDSQHRPVCTQVPLLFYERDSNLYLAGHIMKHTDHHKAFLSNPKVLAVFTGPYSYVSARWYQNPHMASTWNYMSVHCEGSIVFTDQKILEDILDRLSLHFEGGDVASPTVFRNLPQDFKEKTVQAIAGFEIQINQIKNVFKLSQDRDEKSYLQIIENLDQAGHDQKQVALEMKKQYTKIFPKM